MIPSKPAVLLLGCAHLANSNQDVHNLEFDDMLSAKRQAEIRECVDLLKRFRPTKVAVEVTPEWVTKLDEDYKAYLAGRFDLAGNEVHQFGFRIAAELGHERLYGVDRLAGSGDLGSVFEYAQTHQPDIYEESFPRTRQEFKTAQARLGEVPLRELLLRINDPERLAADHRTYLTLARIGSGDDYIGIEWVKGWYERNLSIFANLTRIVTSPEDRVLVIYGAGHVPLLTQFIRDSGLYTLEPVETYLGKPKVVHRGSKSRLPTAG